MKPSEIHDLVLDIFQPNPLEQHYLIGMNEGGKYRAKCFLEDRCLDEAIKNKWVGGFHCFNCPVRACKMENPRTRLKLAGSPCASCGYWLPAWQFEDPYRVTNRCDSCQHPTGPLIRWNRQCLTQRNFLDMRLSRT